MSSEYRVLSDVPHAFSMSCDHCGRSPDSGDRMVQVERIAAPRESVMLHDFCLEARKDAGLDWITGEPR
jgi:hypothetical protein